MRAISGTMTMVTITEYLDLWEATTDVILGEQPDRVICQWTPDGQYTAKSAYKILPDMEDLGASLGKNVHVALVPQKALD